MGDFSQTHNSVEPTVSNGIPPPNFPLPLPESPETITENVLLLIGQTPNPRLKFIYQHLVKHLHAFIRETSITTDEWMTAIQFLTRVGQTCSPLRPEMIFLSESLGASAMVDFINNPVGVATQSSYMGPFHTNDAEDIANGESIASEGKGEYMYVEGHVLTTEGEPIAGAIIDTWETDGDGLYDIQYADRTHPDCRGRLRTAQDGSYGYRAVVPAAYPIPSDGPVGELLVSQGRHNMRPSHLHVVLQAPGYQKLVTALYPDDCKYHWSDALYGVRKSLVVKLEQVNDEEEARKRGFPKGASFRLLKYDFVLLTEGQARAVKQEAVRRAEELSLQAKND